MTRTLLTNGYIHTPGDPGATAMLIEDGRISWIGHEGAALAHKDGVDTEVDLHGALVTPAFVDGHCHVTATGIGLTGLDLSKCHGREELLAADVGWESAGGPVHRARSLRRLMFTQCHVDIA